MTNPTTSPTPLVLDYIRRTLTYDPLTGKILQKEKPIGVLVSRKGISYLVIKLTLDVSYEGCSLVKQVYAHQVAWYLSYGIWPDQTIDHVDGNGANNRLTNLRPATLKQNSYNRRKNRSSTNPYKGVSRRGSSFRAFITNKDKWISLGSFPTAIEAAKAYNTKALELFGVYAYLNPITPDVTG